MQARANTAGQGPQGDPTFNQLCNQLHHDNFVAALGKFSVDDPAKLNRLALANLRENPLARNDLGALQAARACQFGTRQLGNKKWFADKPGVASRLKKQPHRRQFRIGLIANLAFYNSLNMGDTQSLWQAGDPSGLAAVSVDYSNFEGGSIPGVTSRYSAGAGP